MPTYDYACRKCEHTFEVFQNLSEKVLRKCPECGRLALERMFGTGSGVMFKGTGFYETDYRSDSYKKGQAADKKTSSSDDKQGDGGKAAKKTPKTDD